MSENKSDPDVTKREGYPCTRCPKNGDMSCQWRKCRDFQPFYRSAWPAITAPLTPRRKLKKRK